MPRVLPGTYRTCWLSSHLPNLQDEPALLVEVTSAEPARRTCFADICWLKQRAERAKCLNCFEPESGLESASNQKVPRLLCLHCFVNQKVPKSASTAFWLQALKVPLLLAQLLCGFRPKVPTLLCLHCFAGSSLKCLHCLVGSSQRSQARELPGFKAMGRELEEPAVECPRPRN